MAVVKVFRSLQLAVPLAVLLGACGGGGGSSGGDSDVPTVQASLRTIVVEQRVSDPAQTIEFSVTASWSPPDGLYANMSWSGPAIARADWSSTTSNRADLVVKLAAPGDLVPGTYVGNVNFQVCVDDVCEKDVRNSPLTIPVTLTVSEAEPVNVSSNPSAIDLARVNHNGLVPRVEVFISTEATLAEAPHVVVSFTPSIVDSVVETETLTSGVLLEVQMVPTAQLADGTYTGFVDIEMCYTNTCVNKITTAPIHIPVTYRVAPVNTLPEPDIDPLEPRSTYGLAHDVSDAEFSDLLDAVAMVSTYPDSALYVFDVNGHTESQVSLSAAPVAISISPDGQFAGVGHSGGLLTYIDLAELVSTGGTTPTVLNVSTDVSDVVLDGRGFIHVLPQSDQWVNMRSVDVTTNTESIGIGEFYEGGRGRLHPSGDFVYVGDNDISPSDMTKFDVSVVPTQYLYDSPYHGEYDFCGNVWFNNDGRHIFTPCGVVFSASTNRPEDLIYAGTLDLWDNNPIIGFQIRSLSVSDRLNEVALVEYDVGYCPTSPSFRPCHTHLVIYDAQTFVKQAAYSFAPMLVDGTIYGQEGLFVFHNADGTRKFVLSRLENMPEPAAEFYLSEL